jgi:CspA family cold shock protein
MEDGRVRKPTVTTVGIVKSFDDGSGNGLISREDDVDVFVNREAIGGDGPRTLVVGARVRVEVMEGPNGPRACHVRRL